MPEDPNHNTIEATAQGSLKPADYHAPEGFSITACFAITAGLHSSAKILTRGNGGPEYSTLEEETKKRLGIVYPVTWAHIWQYRAALLIGSAFFYDERESLAKARAKVARAQAELKLAELFGADEATLRHIKQDITEGEVYVRELAKASLNPEYVEEPPAGKKIELPLNYWTAGAALKESAEASEGHLLGVYRRLTRDPAFDRIQLREYLNEARETGEIILVKPNWTGGYAADPKRPKEGRSVVCPYCFYPMAANRSLAMEMGQNLGGGQCFCCRSFVDIRAVAEDGVTLDTSGPKLRLYRKDSPVVSGSISGYPPVLV